MRMWLIKPSLLCTQHLLGQHNELHMIAGSIRKNIDLTGYYEKGLLQPTLLNKYHQEIVKEFKRRNWNHKSPLNFRKRLSEQDLNAEVDLTKAYIDLIDRCGKCKSNINNGRDVLFIDLI